MRTVNFHYIGMVAIFLCSVGVSAQTPDSSARSDFEKRARAYSEMRAGIDRGVPSIQTDATPEQINIRKAALIKAVKEARANAKQGEIFTPEAAAMIKRIIAAEYQGGQLADLRETVIEAETKGVPVKVNAEYPESKEKLEMPPQLLLSLPQLPDELRYRFVGKHLLLVDKESGLILDYMTNAVP